MSSKLPCTKCGVMILPFTSEKNNGLCMPCKNGKRSEKKSKLVENILVIRGILLFVLVISMGGLWIPIVERDGLVEAWHNTALIPILFFFLLLFSPNIFTYLSKHRIVRHVFYFLIFLFISAIIYDQYGQDFFSPSIVKHIKNEDTSVAHQLENGVNNKYYGKIAPLNNAILQLELTIDSLIKLRYIEKKDIQQKIEEIIKYDRKVRDEYEKFYDNYLDIDSIPEDKRVKRFNNTIMPFKTTQSIISMLMIFSGMEEEAAKELKKFDISISKVKKDLMNKLDIKELLILYINEIKNLSK